MRRAWNKGSTKKTDPSVAKISETFRRKKIDNFASWRLKQNKKRKSVLKKDQNLAELIGVVLGDGYLGQHERTQVLRIVSNSNNKGFIERYAKMVEDIFGKKPSVRGRKDSNCIDIVLYQQDIASRLGLETGGKTHREYILPSWIARSKKYKLAFLRGLYETDGCVAHHEPTYTHKFIFSNVNQSLLDIVFVLLYEIGFHPTKTTKTVQLSRKAEVARAVSLLKFREYC